RREGHKPPHLERHVAGRGQGGRSNNYQNANGQHRSRNANDVAGTGVVVVTRLQRKRRDAEREQSGSKLDHASARQETCSTWVGWQASHQHTTTSANPSQRLALQKSALWSLRRHVSSNKGGRVETGKGSATRGHKAAQNLKVRTTAAN
ncbi:unnamed protein product, partial [Ectocarpus sp. 13 AM-2016]